MNSTALGPLWRTHLGSTGFSLCIDRSVTEHALLKPAPPSGLLLTRRPAVQTVLKTANLIQKLPVLRGFQRKTRAQALDLGLQAGPFLVPRPQAIGTRGSCRRQSDDLGHLRRSRLAILTKNRELHLDVAGNPGVSKAASSKLRRVQPLGLTLVPVLNIESTVACQRDHLGLFVPFDAQLPLRRVLHLERECRRRERLGQGSFLHQHRTANPQRYNMT